MGELATAIFGGVISKVINDVVDITKETIRGAIHNKHDQSYSTKIYRIIEETLNALTDNEHKDSAELYVAMESIFIEFSKDKDEIEAVRPGLSLLEGKISNNRCEYFIEKFDKAVCKDEELRARTILYLQKKGIKISENGFEQAHNDANKIEQRIDETEQRVDEANQKLDRLEQYFYDKTYEQHNSKNSNSLKLESKTQEYLDKWNNNMFLNDFTEWDRKKGKKRGENITLKDVLCIEEHLPHFWYEDNDEKPFCNMRKLLSKYVLNSSNDNKMLLILGQPGIGKSTLITWIVANFKNKRNDILVYQFVSDLKNIDWGQYDITSEIMKTLNLEYVDLYNKTLILDGFDEINVTGNRREILDKIYWELIKRKKVNNFSLIITSRENYIHNFDRIKCEYIILQPWDEKQIRSFCEVYCEKNKSNISNNTLTNIIKNGNVLGIPLILYMTLALNINIEKESSVVDIYDKIFSLEDGIYDRCIGYAEPHRIGKIKNQIHQISRETAFWMFENKSEEAIIPQEEYQRICKKITINNNDKTNLEKDSIIGNFFKLKYCEGENANELGFVHRSIYEYFVVEYIFGSMCKAIRVSQEELASVFGHFFKKGTLSKTICEFLKHKIQNSILNNKFNIINDTFKLMLKDGMIYYTGIVYKNIIDCEMNVFANMLEIIHLWDNDLFEFEHSICKYLRHNMCQEINLGRVFLKGLDLVEMDSMPLDLPLSDLQGEIFLEADLRRSYLKGAILKKANLQRTYLSETDLRGAELEGAILKKANLRRSDLREADLREANLEKANLVGADLNGADLKEAILTKTIFDESQIVYLEDKYDLSDSHVCLKTGEIISYREYKENN